MKNFLIGLVVGVLLVGLTLLVLVFATRLCFAGSVRHPSRRMLTGDSTWCHRTFGRRHVPERLPAEIPIPILQNQTSLVGAKQV